MGKPNDDIMGTGGSNVQFDLDTEKAKYYNTMTQNAEWDAWLKPVGVGVGAVNMALNIGKYGSEKANLKAQTKYYDTQVADLTDKIADRKVVRDNNRRVMA